MGVSHPLRHLSPFRRGHRCRPLDCCLGSPSGGPSPCDHQGTVVSTTPPPKTSLLRRISSDLGISLQALEVLIGVIGVIVAIIGILVSVRIYQLSNPTLPTTQPSPCTASTCSPSPTPTPTPTPTTPTPDPTPTPTVRRSTEPSKPLTLTQGYAADLDSDEPGWNVKYAGTAPSFDISYAREGWLSGYYSADLAIVSGTASYEVCSTASGYRKSLDRDEVEEGINLCVRTSEKRFAFMTIKKLVGGDYPNEIQLDVMVWNPPFEE